MEIQTARHLRNMPYQCQLLDVTVLSWNTQDEKSGALLIIIIIIIIILCPRTLLRIRNWHQQCTKVIHYITEAPAVVFTYAFHLLSQCYNFKIFPSVTPTRSLLLSSFRNENVNTSIQQDVHKCYKKFRNHVKIPGARKVTWGEKLRTPTKRHLTNLSRPEFVHSCCSVSKIHWRSV